ncbi:hypothetical protein BD626DRAFT_238749 [Schizophyllum amplum]|uniref:Uncharacterized protein n=1 Tax=Schizophyllum amplum TaxID=97359 RepID=A0A550CJL7_9AGAR|nr:hypothetical protein BD626DRAFT_238749 [Auriculariopsis ampla]
METPVCLPQLALVRPITWRMIAIYMQLGQLFLRDMGPNAQELVPQAARDAMQAIIDLAVRGQTLAQALGGHMDAVRQVMLPTSEGPLESYQDLIDVRCRDVIRCLDAIKADADYTNATFFALEFAFTAKFGRARNESNLCELLPAIYKMREYVDALLVQAACLRSALEHMPKRFSLSNLAKLRGAPEHTRRELHDYIRQVYAWHLVSMADHTKELAQVTRNILPSPPVNRDKIHLCGAPIMTVTARAA